MSRQVHRQRLGPSKRATKRLRLQLLVLFRLLNAAELQLTSYRLKSCRKAIREATKGEHMRRLAGTFSTNGEASCQKEKRNISSDRKRVAKGSNSRGKVERKIREY